MERTKRAGSEVPQETIGPKDETELLGSQDENGFQGDPPLGYAVAGCKRLRLREKPDLNARIIAELPEGIGVSATGRAQDNWWEISTGRLIGWVMSQYLEPVWS